MRRQRKSLALSCATHINVQCNCPRMDVLEAMKKEMLRRKLSHKTIMSYIFYVKKFLNCCHKEPKEFSKKDVREFLERYLDRPGNTINVVHNALRFMMEEVLRKSMRLNLRYAKTAKSQPECLTKEEVLRLLDAIKNEKHKLAVSLLYGAGLRVSEVVNLKKQDIDLESDIGWVRHGKGNKDRPFVIPQCLKDELTKQMEEQWLYIFTGRKGHLSVKSVECIVGVAAKKAGIKKNVHPHTLRHSFATHLIEAGNDITIVQALLGHGEPRTTMVYLHMAKPKLISTKSPLDNLR